MRYELCPISLKQAKEFQDAHHRHNVGAKGHKFSIGLSKDGNLVGCATCGRPVSRHLDDGKTLEVTRVCTLTDNKNANSMLYGACVRAAWAMGYTRVITYTLLSESGASLKAAGFRAEGVMKHNPLGWSCGKQRVRQMPERYPLEDKIRWVHLNKTKWKEEIREHENCSSENENLQEVEDAGLDLGPVSGQATHSGENT